jgi:ribosomal protein S24E
VFNKPVVVIVTVSSKPMFTRILTESERKAIGKYLRKDGEKEAAVREIVYRSRKHLPQIEKDLALLRELLEAYERNKTK